MGAEEICGSLGKRVMGMAKLELVLYYAENTPDPVRLMFRGLFERFLSRRELEISRYQPILCPECGSQLVRNVVSPIGEKQRFQFLQRVWTKAVPAQPLSP